MQQHLIRYRTKPDQAAANEALIRAVYEELRNAQPDGARAGNLIRPAGSSYVPVSAGAA